MARKKAETGIIADIEQTPETTQKNKMQSLLADLREKMPGITVGFATDTDINAILSYEKIPTGIITLDPLLNGGFPKGKITTLFGPKSSGKTTLAYHVIANFQVLYPDQYALIVDADNTADKTWMQLIGINLDRIILIPGTNDLEALGDAVVEISQKFGKEIGLVMVDAVGSLIPRAEYAGKKATRGEAGNSSLADDNMAVAARRMGQFLRKVNIIFAKNTVAAIFIAHVYTDLSPTGGGRMIMKGGTALQHFSHVTLRFAQRNDESFKEEVLCPDGGTREIRTGHFVEITIEKTRQSGSQYQQVHIPFRIGIGFDTMTSLFNSAVGYGIIEKAGAWYKYGENPLGQGQANCIKKLIADELLKIEIQDKVTTMLASRGTFGEEAGELPPAEPVTTPAEQTDIEL